MHASNSAGQRPAQCLAHAELHPFSARNFQPAFKELERLLRCVSFLCTLENVVMRRQREGYWPDGCDKLARVALGDGRYCLRHHRLNEGQADRAADPTPAVPRQRRLPGARPAILACLDLDHWDDAATATLRLGATDVRCELCGSWNFVAERPNICCDNGKCSHLPSFPDAPDLMRRLLLGRDRRSRRFHMCLRHYNAALSFVSFGAKI